MKKMQLKATKRDILGRKVKKLRREGILPGNIYGKKIESYSIQVDLKEFAQVYDQVGETGIIKLLVANKIHPVLIHNVQIHPVTRQHLHADFRQVSLKEKVSKDIPVELVGQAQVVDNKQGSLLTILNEIEVEALPTDLPDKIEVEVTQLKEIDEVIKVKDLKVSEKIKILTDGNLDIVKVTPLISKEAEELVKEEEEKAEEAKAEAKEEEKEEEIRAEEKKEKVEEEEKPKAKKKETKAEAKEDQKG